MFNFIFKRRFVKDVQFAVYETHSQTAKGASSFDGFTLNKTAFLRAIESWLKHEEKALDSFSSSSIADIGMACHRARVWVGLYLVHGAYAQGAPDVPARSIKMFYKPSAIVADEYFSRLKDRASRPFSSAFKETFDSAIDRAMA